MQTYLPETRVNVFRQITHDRYILYRLASDMEYNSTGQLIVADCILNEQELLDVLNKD